MYPLNTIYYTQYHNDLLKLDSFISFTLIGKL